MKMTITRSGGLAGEEAETVASLDTGRLDAARAEQVEKAVHQLEARPPEIGADLVRYEIAVDDGGGRSTIIATDDGDPENPLYRLLETASHP